MTTYDLPEDPRRDVWDNLGCYWRYDGERDLYTNYSEERAWGEVFYLYGPLTDTPPQVVALGCCVAQTCHYTDLPDGAIFQSMTDPAGVCVVRYADEGIWRTNTLGQCERLHATPDEPWRRIF